MDIDGSNVTQLDNWGTSGRAPTRGSRVVARRLLIVYADVNGSDYDMLYDHAATAPATGTVRPPTNADSAT